MARTALKVLLADAVLLIAEYFVIQDLAWRTNYATLPHGSAPHGYSPSFSYNVLTQFFTMSGSGPSLTSPPTLDWVQLIAYALVAINVWFGYKLIMKWRGEKRVQAMATPATSSM